MAPRAYTPEDVLRVFWSKVAVAGADDCWLWTGALQTGGYGAISVKRRPYKTHRYSWEIHNGPLPKGSPNGLSVCHRCDTPACVNPAHLFLASSVENTRDRYLKGRSAKGSNNGLSKLNETVVRDIRRRYAAGETQTSLAAELGVSQMIVSAAIRRKNWAWVE